ncbi:MAG: hypothetical protein C4K60_07070 [Ideonella sp. MAG2]|nr:MAG: hypothetical protein C4K60_07070 [Ideonella sp. MAG2]
MSSRVFISYAADDPEWPGTEVLRLAEWIRLQGGFPLLDVLYVQDLGRKASIDEWRQWMARCLADADLVVCLCSPKYELAWDRDQSISGGCGVAFESARIEQYLYDKKQNNRGHVSTLSRLGFHNAIPQQLKAACPSYVWGLETDDDLLRRHLRGEGPGKAVAEEAAMPQPDASAIREQGIGGMLVQQSKHVVELLKKAPTLWRELGVSPNFRDSLKGKACRTPDELPAVLATLDAEAVQDVMYEVREVFCSFKPDGDDPGTRQIAAQATVALYLYCACLLIKARSPDLISGLPRLESDRAAHLMASLIGVSLAGGQIQLVCGEDADLPMVVGTVVLTMEGDNEACLFERELHTQIVMDGRAVQDGLKVGPLSKQERANLIERIKARRGRGHRLKAFNVIVRGAQPVPKGDLEWVTKLSVPVFSIHHDPTFELLAGLDAENMVAMLRELWLAVAPDLAQGVQPKGSDAAGRPSRDLSELATTLQALVEALQGHPAAVNLKSTADQLQAAAKEKKPPERDVLKQTRDTLEGLEKVGEAGEKLLPRLLQLLNFFG